MPNRKWQKKGSWRSSREQEKKVSKLCRSKRWAPPQPTYCRSRQAYSAPSPPQTAFLAEKPRPMFAYLTLMPYLARQSSLARQGGLDTLPVMQAAFPLKGRNRLSITLHPPPPLLASWVEAKVFMRRRM